MAFTRSGPERYELVPEERVRRAVATLNVRWEDKQVFDAIQVWLSTQRGRSVSQWDVFSFVLSAAITNEGTPLARAHLRIGGSA